MKTRASRARELEQVQNGDLFLGCHPRDEVRQPRNLSILPDLSDKLRSYRDRSDFIDR
jgi:hypothetical protein